MLYFLLKVIIRLALRVFFRRFKVNNRHLLPKQGPLIVVSNHPNTFMDPLVTASLMHQNVFFLVKSSFFKPGWQAWLLQSLYMIPVHRSEDVGRGAAKKNTDTFEKCYEFLGKGGTLMIFPEGNSFMQRRLRPIKSGTARIGLGAEAGQDFKLGLQIVPVGLNYSDPSRFRSDVFVNVGEPIQLKDYAAAYQADSFKAAHQLTHELKKRMESLIIHTHTEEEDLLTKQVEAVYQDTLLKEAKVPLTDAKERFQLTKGIVESIRYFETTEPERVQRLRTHLDEYLQHLDQLGLHPDALQDVPRPSQIAWGTLKTLIYLLLGFPVYLFGLIHNYLPYIIPSTLAKKLTKDIEFHAPIMMSVGIFTFPIFYTLIGWGVHEWLDLSGWNLAAYLVLLPLTGFFVLHYWNRIQIARHQWIFFSLFYKRSTVLEHLLAQRRRLMKELEAARLDYTVGLARNSEIKYKS